MGDVFSTFDMKMKIMFEDVVKKEDLRVLQDEITMVKNENIQLRKEIGDIKNRLQYFDQKFRRNNVVVSGLKCRNITEASQSMMDLCLRVLKTNVVITRTIEIKANSDYLFELDSVSQVNNILHNSGKLNGSGVYVQRDYTESERQQRYHLRQVKKSIQAANKNTKCSFKGTTLIVDDKAFKWNELGVIAASEDDRKFLGNLLERANASYDVIVQDVRRNNKKQSSAANLKQ